MLVSAGEAEVTGTEVVVALQPDINPAPAATPVMPKAARKFLRFSARPAAILFAFSTVAAGSRISISVLAIVWASLPVDV
jgi:hypothetical protein